MPNWNKVIVSGSDASLASLNVINGVTASLEGTASYANQALSASYAPGGVGGHTQNTDTIIVPSWDLASDHTANGIQDNYEARAAFVFGEVAYLRSAGDGMALSDANSTDSMPVRAMAIETITAQTTGDFLLQGYARDDTWNWTIGADIYASGTAGGLTQTPTSGSGDTVQVLGWAVTADIMYFNPLGTIVT